MEIQGFYDDLFIGGSWVKAFSRNRTEVVNPASEEVWGSVPDSNEADVEGAVLAARGAFEGNDWSTIGAAKRAEIMLRFADELAARGELMGNTITRENGTPIT